MARARRGALRACYASLTGDHGDRRVGFTLAWAVLVTGLLLVAAGAAAYLLTR